MESFWNVNAAYNFCFVMYYIYGQSGPSLLIESTDSMIRMQALVSRVKSR